MRFHTWLLGLSLILLISTGCGKSGNANPAAGGDSKDGPAATSRVVSAATPTEAVAAFYDALRDGAEETIAALLTDKARSETSKSGLDIRSPGSASLSYEIGEFEYVKPKKDGAHVKSTWTEIDDQGERVSTEVIWVLRKQANGWRIAGMATKVAEDQLPLLFNFEDPSDMLQKKELVERQAAAQEAAAQQASKPDLGAGQSTFVR